jgi:hypothetical protein
MQIKGITISIQINIKTTMSKKRILYVEDDETLAFLTADNLEQHFEVVALQ